TSSAQLVLASAAATAAAPAAAAAAATASPADFGDSANVARVLGGGNLLAVVGAFLLMGLLLSLTPCVLPMLPILSSVIVGQGGAAVSRGRGLLLAATYSLGMALVYTALGVAAGLAGEGLAAALQKPWVLVLFALLLVALALSMFGLYELQLPSAWATRLQAASNRLPGGRLAGVFVMGGLSALIVSPCVTAPLAGALVFIGQSGNVALGGTALFALAAGMSVPLLLLGASAGAWLPKAGGWMLWVKRFFGLLLLGVALYIVQPALPAGWALPWWRAAPTAAVPAPAFTLVRSEADLDAALKAHPGRIALLDFYADWCVSCKEMERFTFTDPTVAALMGRALLLKADVTAHNADDKALLKRFKLFGPPGTIFFDAKGQEQPGLRVIGFQNAERFAQSLRAAGL
ncbi:MAG: protein-disulfide reductase DsbD, partial [Pseudomonadota bacterium]